MPRIDYTCMTNLRQCEISFKTACRDFVSFWNNFYRLSTLPLRGVLRLSHACGTCVSKLFELLCRPESKPEVYLRTAIVRAALCKPFCCLYLVVNLFRCAEISLQNLRWDIADFLDVLVWIDVYLRKPCRFRKEIRSFMYNLDKIDVKIVNLLLEDGRMSASEIARQIGNISERAVRYRIDRMLDESVIRVSAVARPQAFGLTTIADVWMEVRSDRILEVAKKMAEFDHVSYVACGNGNGCQYSDRCKDTAEIYHFVTEVIRKVPGVRKTTTSIVPLILKDVYQWRSLKRYSRKLLSETSPRHPTNCIGGKHMFGSRHTRCRRRPENHPAQCKLKFPVLG
jgi:Lrp/AsnC family transcriptional regulator for asnA, asnC and gidA